MDSAASTSDLEVLWVENNERNSLHVQERIEEEASPLEQNAAQVSAELHPAEEHQLDLESPELDQADEEQANDQADQPSAQAEDVNQVHNSEV